MKELKFRFWNKEKNRYVATKTLGVALENGVFDLGKHIDIEQFTGLHDKNGNEIYEGDIVEIVEDNDDLNVWDHVGKKSVVEFNKHRAGYEPFCLYDSDCGYRLESEWTEIIGNIHKNQEKVEA